MNLGLLRIVLVGSLAATTLGCGGSSSSSAPTAPSSNNNATVPSSDANTVVITITSTNGSRSFSPDPASISAGQRVIWHNADFVTHRVVLNDGTIDTGDLAPGQSSEAKAWVLASAQYHCALHPTMVGSVNAASTQEPSPTTPPDY